MKYTKILDFMKQHITDDMLAQFKDGNTHYYVGGKHRSPLSISDVVNMVSYNSGLGSIEVPWKIVDYNDCYYVDHSHGCWSERYVLKIGNKFWAMCFEYYGDSEFYEESTLYNEVTEVFPKTITKVIYE